MNIQLKYIVDVTIEILSFFKCHEVIFQHVSEGKVNNLLTKTILSSLNH